MHVNFISYCKHLSHSTFINACVFRADHWTSGEAQVFHVSMQGPISIPGHIKQWLMMLRNVMKGEQWAGENVQGPIYTIYTQALRFSL